MTTLNFNTASISTNDAIKSSDSSDISDNENYIPELDGSENWDTEEDIRRKEAVWKFYQENPTSSEEENNEVEYISSDTAERKMGQKSVPSIYMGTTSVYKGPHNIDRMKEHTISKLLVRGPAKSSPVKNKLQQKNKKL